MIRNKSNAKKHFQEPIRSKSSFLYSIGDSRPKRYIERVMAPWMKKGNAY